MAVVARGCDGGEWRGDGGVAVLGVGGYQVRSLRLR